MNKGHQHPQLLEGGPYVSPEISQDRYEDEIQKTQNYLWQTDLHSTHFSK